MKHVALITGASSGIGKELCTIHAQKGGDLVIVARRQIELDQLKNELEQQYGIKVLVVVQDLSLHNAAQEVYQLVKEAGWTVDYLINNAGFGGLGKFHEREWEKDAAMIQVNMVALTELTRLFLPEFVERNRGKILNVSSSAALIPGPLQAVYYATKAYVTSFSNALAEELHDTQVTVTTLMPGVVKTAFAQVSGIDQLSMGQGGLSPQKVAQEAYHGMLKGKLNVYSAPFTQKLMVYFIPFIPRKFMLKMIRKMQEME